MTEAAGGLLEPKRRSLTVKEMMLEAQKIKKKLRFLVEEVINVLSLLYPPPLALHPFT